MILRPFWRYYGGKWRAARADLYPAPAHRHIIEPFAGAAGYSLRWGRDRDVTLIDKYPVVAGIWKWLVAADPKMVLAIPEVDDVDALPEWVPQPARDLVGFHMNYASSTPQKVLSKAKLKHRAAGRHSEGWTVTVRARVAEQIQYIRHWRVVDGSYLLAPDEEATWFVDPPYIGKAGRRYALNCGSTAMDYAELAAWCLARHGQTIVCEAGTASWLPFIKLAATHSARGVSDEVVWLSSGAPVNRQGNLFA